MVRQLLRNLNEIPLSQAAPPDVSWVGDSDCLQQCDPWIYARGRGVPRSFAELPETRNLKLQAPWQIRPHSLRTPSHITAASKNLAEAVWVWFYWAPITTSSQLLNVEHDQLFSECYRRIFQLLQLCPQLSKGENCKRRKQCAPMSPSVHQALRLNAFDAKDVISFSRAFRKMPIWRSHQPVWDPMNCSLIFKPLELGDESRT